jgi:hypothetical protein
MVQLNFNAQEVAPSAGIQTYPSGTYDVMINDSKLVETKAKKAGTVSKGSFLQLNLKITTGEHVNGTIIARVNFENENPTAEEIGQAELSAICRVCGVMQLQDSQQLHGIPFRVILAKVERNDKPGEFGNEVKGYQTKDGVDPDKIGAAAPATAAPAPVAQAAPTPPQTAPQPVNEAAPPPVNAAPVAAPAATQPPVEQAPAAAAPAAPPWAQNPTG